MRVVHGGILSSMPSFQKQSTSFFLALVEHIAVCIHARCKLVKMNPILNRDKNVSVLSLLFGVFFVLT